MSKEININNKDFVAFLNWYREVYANEHITEFDTTTAIINVVEAPHNYQREYAEYQLVKYQDVE